MLRFDEPVRRGAQQVAPWILGALAKQGPAEVGVDGRQPILLERGLVQLAEAPAPLRLLVAFPQAAGVLITRGVGEAGYLVEEGPGLDQLAVEVGVLAGPVLEQGQQHPAENAALVAAHVLQGALPFRPALVGADLEDAVALPALVQGVRDAQVVEKALAPLAAAGRPLAGVLAQDRAAVQGQVMGQRLVHVLGQDVDVLPVEVGAARGQEDVEAELPLVASVEGLLEDRDRPVRVAGGHLRGEQGQRILEAQVLESSFLEFERPLDVIRCSVGQGQDD